MRSSNSRSKILRLSQFLSFQTLPRVRLHSSPSILPWSCSSSSVASPCTSAGYHALEAPTQDTHQISWFIHILTSTSESSRSVQSSITSSNCSEFFSAEKWAATSLFNFSSKVISSSSNYWMIFDMLLFYPVIDICRSCTVLLDISMASSHLSISYLCFVLKWYFLVPISI